MFKLFKKSSILFFIIFALAALAVAYAADASPHSLQGKTVILDAGHGFDNTNTYEGYDEQVAMLKLALKIKPLLEARGATVYMTRPTPEDITLPARAAIINQFALQYVKDLKTRELTENDGRDGKAQNDILEINRLIAITQSIIDDPETNAPIYLNTPFDYTYTRTIHPDWQRIFEYENNAEIRNRFLVISLHSNATPKPIDTSRDGVYAYHISNSLEKNMTYYADYSYETLNQTFGKMIIRNINTVGINERDVLAYYYLIIREHNLPCVLVENGFHTNPQDREKLLDDAFLDRLATVYDGTIAAYFSALPATEDYRNYTDDMFGQR